MTLPKMSSSALPPSGFWDFLYPIPIGALLAFESARAESRRKFPFSPIALKMRVTLKRLFFIAQLRILME